MGKIAQNKQKKKAALLQSAFELFTTTGFSSATIGDIAERAGVAKGTFYLYFNDKEDLRDELIRIKAGQLLLEACRKAGEYIHKSAEKIEIADKFVYIVDYLIDSVANDIGLMQFLSKHLSWGLFAEGDRRHPNPSSPVSGTDSLNFEHYITRMLEQDNVKLKNHKLLIFTLLELISSTCYDVIIYREPVSLEEFKPYLYSTVRLLVNDAIVR